MNKYFDAKQMEGFIDALDFTNKKYRDRADYLEVQFLRYVNNDRHQGDDAEVAKLLVREKEIGFLNDLRSINKKVQDLYIHAKEEFHNKVDSAPDARLDIETLSRIERDFKRYYKVKSEHGANIERIARDLQDKYGHLTTFTQPSFEAGRENLRELCGGDEENTGFINGVITSFIRYDAEEKEYIKASGFEEDVENLAASIKRTGNALNESFIVKGTTTDKGFLTKIHDSIVELFNNTSSLFSNPNLLLIKDDFVREYITQFDLTDEQVQYVINLQNLKNHDGLDYTDKIQTLQAMAITLFAEGYDEIFVAGMLGNIYKEGNVGGLEAINDVLVDEEHKHWARINSINLDTGGTIRNENELSNCNTYFDVFSPYKIYEVDFQEYLILVDQFRYNEKIDNVIGCGCCMWTERNRFNDLMTAYQTADANGDNNNQLSLEECLEAEASLIALELREDTDYRKFHQEVVVAWDETENKTPTTAATLICDEYEKPNEEDRDIETRINAAEDIYSVMIGE